MVKFVCPHCRKVLAVSSRHAGRRGRCKYCRGMVRAPYKSTIPHGSHEHYREHKHSEPREHKDDRERKEHQEHRKDRERKEHSEHKERDRSERAPTPIGDAHAGVLPVHPSHPYGVETPDYLHTDHHEEHALDSFILDTESERTHHGPAWLPKALMVLIALGAVLAVVVFGAAMRRLAGDAAAMQANAIPVLSELFQDVGSDVVVHDMTHLIVQRRNEALEVRRASVTGRITGLTPDEYAGVVLLQGEVAVPDEVDRDFLADIEPLVLERVQADTSRTYRLDGIDVGTYTLVAFAFAGDPIGMLDTVRMVARRVTVQDDSEVKVDVRMRQAMAAS